MGQFDTGAVPHQSPGHGSPGENYLIQHSAGSGKSNTIAWPAHQLAKRFFCANNQPTFDSIIIRTGALTSVSGSPFYAPWNSLALYGSGQYL
jgi:hypothetical protein